MHTLPFSITHLDSLIPFIMLQTLDISNNSIYGKCIIIAFCIIILYMYICIYWSIVTYVYVVMTYVCTCTYAIVISVAGLNEYMKKAFTTARH